MQNECVKSSKNYYFLCRKVASQFNDALSSRANAAARLNIAESTLRNYEVDTAAVPQDIVCAMADLYGMPEMESHYCKMCCPIGKHVGSSLTCEVKTIESVAVNFLTHTNREDMQDMQNTVLKIAIDGKISQQEREQLRNVVGFIENIARDVSDMKILLERKCRDGA
jgi:hypothetical protein